MCDYSLQHMASRPARVGETLTTYHFGTGTRGFHVPQEAGCAVCVLPGTELGFAHDIKYWENGVRTSTRHRTAIFRQVNKQIPHVHHDALELPDGRVLMGQPSVRRPAGDRAATAGYPTNTESIARG